MKGRAIERVFLPSHIRRGRLQTSPSWQVVDDNGERRTFMRKSEAVAFATIVDAVAEPTPAPERGKEGM